MQAQKEAPPDMQCKDKFLLQSVVASPGATAKDMTPEMVTIQQMKNCSLIENMVLNCGSQPQLWSQRQDFGGFRDCIVTTSAAFVSNFLQY